MENSTIELAPTLENVWALMTENARQMKENERILNEKFAETDRLFKESRKRLDETLGAWANNQGAFAEEYFFNSFEHGKNNFFGEKFDEIEKNIKGIEKNFKDEYDILLINGNSIGIVEVKFKAHVNDVAKVLRKAVTFKVNFPKYANHRIYLGLATMSFYPELEKECIEQGIAIIKQVGDTVVINDTHLRAW